MKKWFVSLFFATLSTLLGAQTAAGEVAPDINVERARISAARATLESGFLAEDAACYKKFAVNHCLDRVNTRRREAIADLRRQEVFLNDEERRLRGAAQLRKLEEKLSVEKQQDAAASSTKTQEDGASRLIREKKKSDDQATTGAREKTAIEASAARLKENQRKAQVRTDNRAEAALAAEKLSARQKKAQERRDQHERDRLKEIKPPAKSLPLPE
jgi:septal ring factor EnvC (AmiA/AmiB activator)